MFILAKNREILSKLNFITFKNNIAYFEFPLILKLLLELNKLFCPELSTYHYLFEPTV